MFINLLEETKKVLKENKHSIGNIKYVRNAEGYIPIADFVEAAQNFNYDNESKEPQVDPALTIVGKFWWLSRIYLDKHEQWMFHFKPKKPELLAVGFTLKNTRATKQTNKESKD